MCGGGGFVEVGVSLTKPGFMMKMLFHLHSWVRVSLRESLIKTAPQWILHTIFKATFKNLSCGMVYATSETKIDLSLLFAKKILLEHKRLYIVSENLLNMTNPVHDRRESVVIFWCSISTDILDKDFFTLPQFPSSLLLFFFSFIYFPYHMPLLSKLFYI